VKTDILRHTNSVTTWGAITNRSPLRGRVSAVMGMLVKFDDVTRAVEIFIIERNGTFFEVK
jgi:hypothetical protein